MSPKEPIGAGRLVVLVVLAVGMVAVGVHAMLADSVTTPARFGGDQRVYGSDTVFVGVGWVLMGLSIATKILLRGCGGHADSVVAVAIAVIGALFWFSVL